ncbi:MAG: replicative DNA helicase [Lachnospiraceae bacterium]|nr:replicative DNA helicase [Lachnospiraceae bacterium]MBP5653379.1 replicative DNA helicase [Lachnospiraceae bacterium]
MEEAIIRRVMPYSAEAEQAVLGAMIMSREAIQSASEILLPEDFYQQKFAILYSTILELTNEGKVVDIVTLQDRLKTKDVPQDMSSLSFISQIARSVPTAANVRHYADIVKEKAIKRRLIAAAEKIENQCYLDREDLDSVLDSSEKQVFEISQNRRTSEFENIRDVVLRAIDNIEAASKSKGSVTGVATGFFELDYKLAGLQNSDLILLAARPSMGKTALALNIAEHAVTKLRVPTAFFSLEMSKVQLVNRLISMDSQVQAQAIRTGQLSDQDWTAITDSARKLSGSTLFIDDTPSISVSELRSKCRKLKLEHGLGLIIIDYLQLMTATTGKASESRQQEISEISRSLKAIAREINCPVLALSQLSRAVEGRPDKRPMLSDLRESGAIEQDADVVMFIYRDEYYNHDSEKKGIAEVIIGKQRNGPTGTVELAAQLEYTRFKNLARE